MLLECACFLSEEMQVYISIHNFTGTMYGLCTLLWCVYVLVTQSYLTLCDPMDCSSPGSSVHGIFQSRILERVAIPFSRGSSHPRNQTQASCLAGRFFTIWATRGAHVSLCCSIYIPMHQWHSILITIFFFFICSGFCHTLKQPWVYMCSPSQSPLPPPSPPVPSRFSQCTRSERLSHASKLGWWSVSP